MVGSKVSSACCTWASVTGALPAVGVCSGRSSAVTAGVSSAVRVTSVEALTSAVAAAGSYTARTALGRQLTERERVSIRARVRLIGCIMGVVPFSTVGGAIRGSRGKITDMFP